MAANDNNTRNELIRDVKFFWAKLDPKKPVEDNYGNEIWDVLVAVPKKRKKELEAFGKVRDLEDGLVGINLKKKAFKKDGSPAAAIKVVDGSKQEMDPKIIGNGSVGNVIVMLRDYQVKHPKTGKVTKEGTAVNLSKVQVTELIKYEPKGGMDFDAVEGDGDGNNDEFEDDIPF